MPVDFAAELALAIIKNRRSYGLGPLIDAYTFPYMALVQSSGHGKTRALLEVGKRFLPMMYVCLRDRTSSGHPPRTEGFADDLLSGSSEPNVFSTFTLLLLHEYLSFLRINGATSPDSGRLGAVQKTADLDRLPGVHRDLCQAWSVKLQETKFRERISLDLKLLLGSELSTVRLSHLSRCRPMPLLPTLPSRYLK